LIQHYIKVCQWLAAV